MLFSRLIIVILVQGLAWSTAFGGPAAEVGSGSRPLPHPEILQVPPPSPKSSAENPAPVARDEAKQDSSNISLPGHSEDKEIARQNGGKPDGTVVAKTAGTIARNTGRFSVFSELWPLLAVLALIGAAALLVKKFMPARKYAVGADVLRIVARTPISPKQQLMLVKLGRQLVLLGVSSERISALTTVEDPDQVAMLLGEAASSRPDSMTRAFADSIVEETEKYDFDVTSDEDVTEATRGEVQGLLNKVRQMAGKS